MNHRKTFRNVLLAGLGAGALSLGGCMTPTTYHPVTGTGIESGGYSDAQIAPDTYTVSFAGNSATSRDTVDRYLFYRAAQLTLQHGGTWFTATHGTNDVQSEVNVTPDPLGPGFGWNGWGGYWAPSWRYHGPFGWRDWSPWGGSPYWGETVDVNTVDRYVATATIKVGKGPMPTGNPRAYDAKVVIDRLAPTIKLPK